MYEPPFTVSYSPSRGLCIYRGGEVVRQFTDPAEVPHLLAQIGFSANFGGLDVDGRKIEGDTLKALAAEAVKLWGSAG